MVISKKAGKLFRFDERAKVSFALVAVLVLMLSAISVVYIAYINRVEKEREQGGEITSIMEHKVNVAQEEIETQTYFIAMDAIYKATTEENDQNRIIPIFNENLEEYMEKYTEGEGNKEGDYYVKVDDYTAEITQDSKMINDFIPVTDPGSSGIQHGPWIPSKVGTGELAKGIDVSGWQGAIDWTKVYKGGFRFAFCKATEGTGFTDNTFKTNMNNGKNAGMLMAPYHYAKPNLNSGEAEALHFANVVRPFITSDNLRPALDLEEGSELGKVDLSRWVHDFMTTFQRETGVVPIIYVNTNYAINHLDTSVNQYDLWIAQWTYDTSVRPDTGIWGDWDFWQYSNKGSVPGIAGNVDLNLLNGNVDDLRTYVVGDGGKDEYTDDIPTNCYYNLDVDIEYHVDHKDSDNELDKNMSFSKVVETPYPILENKFEQFNSYAKTGSSELGRMVQYILTTIAQYRVLQGFGASEIDGNSFGAMKTDDIIRSKDIELAVNLAILLESAKLYRDYDRDFLQAFEANNNDVDKTMASLIDRWITEEQIDPADIIVLFKGLENQELNLSVILGQAIYALADQFVLKYLHYFGYINLVDAIWQVAQVGWNAVEGFFEWFTDLFPQDEEKKAEVVKDWVGDQFGKTGLDSEILNDTEVQVEEKNYGVQFHKDGTCSHDEDADGEGDKDDSVNYHWEVDSKYTVVIPSSTEEVDFEEMDLFRDDVDWIWENFYDRFFSKDNEKNIVKSLSETLKEISVAIAANFAELDGLSEIFESYRTLPTGAISPDDDVTFLETIQGHVGALMGDTIDYFKSEAGKDGIEELILNVISDQNMMIEELTTEITENFDNFASKEYNVDKVTQELTRKMIDAAFVLPGDGNIVKRDNPEEIKYPDVPPGEPGRLPAVVPYIHQVFDPPGWFNGQWACGAASAMMALAYYGLIPPNEWGADICEEYTYNGFTFNKVANDPNGRPAKGGYGYICQNNWENTKNHMAGYAQKHGLTSSVDWSPTWGELTAEIDAGHPVVLLTSLTGPGHYVLAVGYDTNSHVVIVNDPYGNKNVGYVNRNGANAEYDWPGTNAGHSNLNTVHCYIYFKGDLPGTRSRGDVTPDEWRVMQCPHDEHPPLDAGSLPKYSDSEILNKFEAERMGEVEAYARSLVEGAYQEIKDAELERYESGLHVLTETTGNDILDMIIDGVATIGHASGLLPAACAFVSSVAADIIYSSEIRNNVYFLPISVGEKFSFWSGGNNLEDAVRKGKAYYDTIDVDIVSLKGPTEDYLVDGEDITITVSDAKGVHYTNLTEFHSRPFETTWEIKVEGSFQIITETEERNLPHDGEHKTVKKTDTIELNISSPITVFSGWQLEGVDYWDTSTLWGDIAGFVLDFLSGVWDVITGLVGMLIDGLMKVLTILVNIIHAIVNFASKLVKVVVDVLTWIIEKVRDFIQKSMNLVATALMGICHLLGDGFNFSAFGILFNVTTKFEEGDIPADGWIWMTRLSSRLNINNFGLGFDLSVVKKDDAEDYDILITSGMKVGDFILEVAMDPMMTVWPRFIEGHGVYLNETGQGFGIDFTSPEVDTGWSVLGSIKFEKGSVKKVVKIPASKVTIPYVGTARSELGIKLSWPTKIRLDGKVIAAKINETFYEVWHDLGGRFPMDRGVIDVYSQKLLESFKTNLGPVLKDLGDDVKLEIWLKLEIKPFGGRFKLAGLSGYTVWRTTLKFDTNMGKDLETTVNYMKAYHSKYLEDPGQRPGDEPLPETGIDVKLSTEAKVHVKKIFSKPVTIPVIGVDAKGEVGFSISCKYSEREETSQAWDNIKAQLNADWEAAKAGESMKNLADKAKGLVEYLGDEVEFKLWMKLHLAKEFGSYGDLASTINVDFTMEGVEPLVDGFNWVKSNIDKYLVSPGENITASPPPEVKIRVYITTSLELKHKVAKIPIPAIGCTADITIGFKFSIMFKSTSNLTEFMNFMNASFDEVDKETNSTPQDQNLVTIYAQKIILKFKQAIDYIMDNGQISFYVKFDLDVGGLDALEAGIILKFIMKCNLTGLWEIAKWIMGSVGAFVNNVLNPANAARSPDVPKEYLEKIHIEFEAFVQAGLPDMIKDITGGLVGFKIRLSAIISTNLPMIAAMFGQDWGRFRARFGVVLKIDITLKLGIEEMFDFMDVEMHPHAWFRLWFFECKIYEIG